MCIYTSFSSFISWATLSLPSFLAHVNNTAIDTRVERTLTCWFHCIFWENSILFFTMSVLIYIPINSLFVYSNFMLKGKKISSNSGNTRTNIKDCWTWYKFSGTKQVLLKFYRIMVRGAGSLPRNSVNTLVEENGL